ncbi:MAG: flagellar hook-length control protein FliK, partial [Pseudomonadota bacterium]
DDAPDAAAPAEIMSSTPRQRGMAGRLAMLADAKPKTQDKGDASSFSDRLTTTAPESDKTQDRQTVQSDGFQRDKTQTNGTLQDGVADQGAPLTSTAQSLPLDSRATNMSAPSPQRGPYTSPLDTTQSVWEAALTERITTRSNKLGQEIEITLSPDNLGTVRIKLDLSDNAATVQIVTDTPQAAQLFQQSEARLAEAFNRAGLSLTSHDASSRDPGARDPGANGQRQGQNPGNPRAEAALAGLRGKMTAPVQTGRAANLVNIVA